MISYAVLRERLVQKVQQIVPETVFRFKASTSEEVINRSEKFFNMSSSDLVYEVEDIKIKSGLLSKKEFILLAYPKDRHLFGVSPRISSNASKKKFFVRGDAGRLLIKVPSSINQKITVDEIQSQAREMHPEVTMEPKEIKRAIKQQSNEWIEVGSYAYDFFQDASYELRVGDDNLKAFIKAKKAGTGGSDPSSNDIIKYLKSEGIVYGIREDLLGEFEKAPIYNQWVEVATGTHAVKGTDAYIELLDTPSFSLQRKRKQKNNFVSHAQSVQTVKKGETFARIVPETSGVEGKTLYGLTIFPEATKGMNLVAGKHVKLSDDGQLAIALEGGSVVIKDNRVDIDELLIVDGDLAKSEKAFTFPGTVIIKGDVLDDCEVDVKGNMQVEGNVYGANIKIGGSLLVEHGIIGKGKAQINTQYSVSAKFVENSTVTSGENCHVTDGLLNSTIIASKTIFINEGKGLVSNSSLYAQVSIIIKDVHSHSAAGSSLNIVSFPEHRVKITALEKTLTDKRSEFARIQNFLGQYTSPQEFKKLEENMQNKVEKEFKKLVGLKEEIETKQKSLNKMKELLKRIKTDGKIVIMNSVDANTTVVINETSQVLKSDLMNVVFYLNDDTLAYRNLNERLDVIDLKHIIDQHKV